MSRYVDAPIKELSGVGILQKAHTSLAWMQLITSDSWQASGTLLPFQFGSSASPSLPLLAVLERGRGTSMALVTASSFPFRSTRDQEFLTFIQGLQWCFGVSTNQFLELSFGIVVRQCGKGRIHRADSSRRRLCLQTLFCVFHRHIALL